MSIIVINNENFNEIVNGEKPVLVDFYADWCGPCQMMAPIVHEIAEERSDIVVGKIDVDASPELAMKFGVQSIPTLVLMKDGKVADSFTGLRPREAIIKLVDKN